MNIRAILLCGALSAATLPAADTLTEEFQRALFEEEANRNLPAAIAGYEAVIKRLDEQRQLAATAVFRLGESYRKLGKTNEAVSAYERIIREFADQETLVKLSGQNLSILRPSRTLPATLAASASGSPTAADLTELRRLEILLETVRSLEPMSDAELRTLLEFANDDEAAQRLKAWRNWRTDLERLLSDLRNRPEDKTVAERVQSHERLVQDGEAWWSEWRAATLRMLEARVEAARRLAARGDTVGAANAGSNENSMTAEEAEELRRVQGLVANSPDLINAPGKDGLPPLHQAIQNGHVHVFRYLLDHGAEVNNQRGSDSSSPLHTAAAGGQLVILDELLGKSADPSLRSVGGNTPLHLAARLGFVAVAERLLKAGADINARETLNKAKFSSFSVC